MENLEQYQLKYIRRLTASSHVYHILLIALVFLGLFLYFYKESNTTLMNFLLMCVSFLVSIIVMKAATNIEDYIRHIPRKRFLKKILPISLPVPNEYISFFKNDLEFLLQQSKVFSKMEKKPSMSKLFEAGIEGYEFVIKRLELNQLTKKDINFINSYFSREITNKRR